MPDRHLDESAHNRSVKTHLRRLQKQIRSAPERTADQIRAAISAIDKAAKSGVIHRNAANRRKARLNKALAGEIGAVAASRSEAQSLKSRNIRFDSRTDSSQRLGMTVPNARCIS